MRSTGKFHPEKAPKLRFVQTRLDLMPLGGDEIQPTLHFIGHADSVLFIQRGVLVRLQQQGLDQFSVSKGDFTLIETEKHLNRMLVRTHFIVNKTNVRPIAALIQ